MLICCSIYDFPLCSTAQQICNREFKKTEAPLSPSSGDAALTTDDSCDFAADYWRSYNTRPVWRDFFKRLFNTNIIVHTDDDANAHSSQTLSLFLVYIEIYSSFFLHFSASLVIDITQTVFKIIILYIKLFNLLSSHESSSLDVFVFLSN